MEFIVVKRLTSICFVHWFLLGQRHPDYTRAVIKDKLNDTDNEIATTSCKVSLACPLGNVYLNSFGNVIQKYFLDYMNLMLDNFQTPCRKNENADALSIEQM